MLRLGVLSLLALGALVCGPHYEPAKASGGGKDSGDTGHTGEPQDTDTDTALEDAFRPVEGAWQVISESMAYDNCNMEQYVIDGTLGTLTVAMSGDTGLSLTHSRATETCVLDSEAQSYTCTSNETVDTTPIDDFGLDATILLVLTAGGDFATTRDIEMRTDVVVNCEGPECWLVELGTSAMPCSMQVLTLASAP